MLDAGRHTIRGRAYAGEGTPVRDVAYRIDDGPWLPAELVGPNDPGVWVAWHFDWHAEPGSHTISVRATDHNGTAQPDSVPWNHHGYLYNAVAPHPVTVH